MYYGLLIKDLTENVDKALLFDSREAALTTRNFLEDYGNDSEHIPAPDEVKELEEEIIPSHHDERMIDYVNNRTLTGQMEKLPVRPMGDTRW